MKLLHKSSFEIELECFEGRLLSTIKDLSILLPESRSMDKHDLLDIVDILLTCIAGGTFTLIIPLGEPVKEPGGKSKERKSRKRKKTPDYEASLAFTSLGVMRGFIHQLSRRNNINRNIAD
jgi:hypothetical protein